MYGRAVPFSKPPRYCHKSGHSRFTPGQTAILDVAAVRPTADAGRFDLVPLKWGLNWPWSKDAEIVTGRLNARAESVADKPAFLLAFKQRRCLIRSDGYYK